MINRSKIITFRIYLRRREPIARAAWISYKVRQRFGDLRDRGIYPGKAPIGYCNGITNNQKSIFPDEQAEKVQLLFVAFLQPEVGISELLKLA